MDVLGPADSSLGRWRTFADAVALALGSNLWVALVLLPGLVSGVLHSGPAQLTAILPLMVLGVGVWRRSDLLLLLGYPSALLIPVAFAPGMANVHVYGPIRFAIVAIGLVGYLFGASVFTSFRVTPPPLGERPLSSSVRPMAPRWRRRFRIYIALTAMSAVIPLLLLYTINFDGEVRELLKVKYPGRVTALSTVMNLGAIGFWVAIYAGFFLGVLRPHRTGDRDLLAGLEKLRRETRRARPRLQFYLGVAVALGLMLVLLLMRGS